MKKIFGFMLPLMLSNELYPTEDSAKKEEVKPSAQIDNSEREIYNKARKFVVMVSTTAHLTADSWGGSSSSWKGSGFIINKEKGLILTNKHVIGELSVASYEVKFHDGTVLKAEYVYADPIYDFGFIKVDPAKIPVSATAGELDTSALEINESIYSIGNSAGDEFSVHKGIVFSIYENLGPFSEQSFQFSGITVGGASGSPIIGENHKIKGILYGGKFVSGAGLPIAYVNRVLKDVVDAKEPKRYSIGAIFEYQTSTDALESGLISKEQQDLYKKEFPESGDKIVAVSTRIVKSPAFDLFQPGDIIFKVNNKLVGPNLLMIDEEIDEAGKSNKKISLTIYRNGKEEKVDLQPYQMLLDADFDFIQFGGGLFSDVSEKIRLKTGINEGVLALYLDPTSPFKDMGSKGYFYGGSQTILIQTIDGKPLKNLKDLEGMIPNLLKKDNFIVRYINQNGYSSRMSYENINDQLPRQAIVKYNKKFDTPKVYKRNPTTKEWDTKTIILEGEKEGAKKEEPQK